MGLFWGFFVWYLLSRICPSCSRTQIFLVPFLVFVFCCSRRGVSGASIVALRQRSPPISRGDGNPGDCYSIQYKPTICPQPQAAAQNQETREAGGATGGPCSAQSSVTCGASCAFPILTKRGLLLWFGLLSFLEFPLQVFFPCLWLGAARLLLCL